MAPQRPLTPWEQKLLRLAHGYRAAARRRDGLDAHGQLQGVLGVLATDDQDNSHDVRAVIQA
jgi:hypothetical protein